MEITWKGIASLVWAKLTGEGSRDKYLNKQTELVIKGVWDLYEEKKKIASEYAEQLKVIDRYKKKHPDNGEELDKWKQREYKLMLDLVAAKEQIAFWKERAIFLEHENDLMWQREENKKGRPRDRP